MAKFGWSIFAVATGQARHLVSPLAVIRVSGSKSLDVIKAMTRVKDVIPRRAYFATVLHSHTGKVLDRAMMIYFKKPNSYTGEDVVEFHCHGGVSVVDAILDSLSCIEGCRPAGPGEFTKRAVLSGKMSLLQAEAVHNLVQSQTEKQRELAVRQLANSENLQKETEFYVKLRQWRHELIECQAKVEAFLNFGEDENIPVDEIYIPVKQKTKLILLELESYLKKTYRCSRIRDGVKVGIIGAPNVGKSSLINILCERSVAIVSPTEGTTRDVVEASINFHGWPLVIQDTAGIRESDDLIEQEGIARSLEVISTSDLIIHLQTSDCSESSSVLKNALENCKKPVVKVLNKVDLDKSSREEVLISPHFMISCLTREGIEGLLDELKSELEQLNVNEQGELEFLVTTSSQQKLLEECREVLTDILSENDELMVGELLKCALHVMTSLHSPVLTDELLDVVFKQFCIGK